MLGEGEKKKKRGGGGGEREMRFTIALQAKQGKKERKGVQKRGGGNS